MGKGARLKGKQRLEYEEKEDKKGALKIIFAICIINIIMYMGFKNLYLFNRN